ncbi:uro-adherence factor A-like [Macrobrachium rosenbergii]|uniref:uro-adherence factor A-like n=1 Tax=Macrobrachium rosenbergii TaxID=79674 RepID=UPI0034D76913
MGHPEGCGGITKDVGITRDVELTSQGRGGCHRGCGRHEGRGMGITREVKLASQGLGGRQRGRRGHEGHGMGITRDVELASQGLGGRRKGSGIGITRTWWASQKTWTSQRMWNGRHEGHGIGTTRTWWASQRMWNWHHEDMVGVTEDVGVTKNMEWVSQGTWNWHHEDLVGVTEDVELGVSFRPQTEEVPTEDPAEVRWRSRRRASSVSAVSPDPSHLSGDAIKDANSRAYWRRVRSLSRENRQRQEARDRQLKRSELEERRRREHILAERKKEKDALMRRFLREPLELCRIRAAKENSRRKNDDMNDEEIAIETESSVRPSQSAPDLDEALRIVRGEDKALDARAQAFLSSNRRRRYCSEEKSQPLKEEKICDRFLRTHNPRIPPHQPPTVPFAGQTKRRVPGPPTRPFPPGSSDDIIRENQKPYPTLPPEELMSKARPKRSSSIGENSLKMGTTKVLNDTFGATSGLGEISSIFADYKPPLESHIMVLPKPKLERRSSMPDLRDFRFVSSAVVYETIAALSNLGDARGLMVLPSHDLTNSVDLNDTSAPEIISSKSQPNEFFHKNSQKWVKKMTKYIKEETQAVLSHSPLIGSLSPSISQIGLQKGRKAQRKEWIAKHSSLKNLQKTILPTFSETASQTENIRPMSAVLHRRNSLGSEGADSVYYDSLEEDESRTSKQSSTTQAFYVPMKNDIPANKVLAPTLPARLTARLEKRRTVSNKRPLPNTVPPDNLLLTGKHIEVLSDEALLTHLTANEDQKDVAEKSVNFSDVISKEDANVSSDSDILDSPKVKETICNGNLSPQISDQSTDLSQSDIIQITSTDVTQKGSLNSLTNIADTISNSLENRSEMSAEKSDPLPEPSSAQYSDTYTQITDQSSYAPANIQKSDGKSDKEESKSNAAEENSAYNENSISEIGNEDIIRNKKAGSPAIADEISSIRSEDNEDKSKDANEIDAGVETQAEENQENKYENLSIDNQNETYDNVTALQHSVEEEIPKSESSEENYNTDSFHSVSYSYEKSEEDISEVLDNADSDIQNNESNSEVEVQTATPEPISNNTSGSSAVHDNTSGSVVSENNNLTKDSPKDTSNEISEETSSNPSQDQLEIIGFTSHGKETLLESGFIDCDDASLTPDPLNNNCDKSGLFSTNEPGSETEIDNNKGITMNADKSLLEEVDQKMVAEHKNETCTEGAMGQHVQSDANNPEMLSHDSKQLSSMEDMIIESLQDGDFGMSLNDGFFLNDDESASPILINEVDQEELSDGNDSSDRITVIRVPSGESNYDSGDATPDIDTEFPLPIEEDTNEYVSEDSVSPRNTVPDNNCETDLLHEIFSSHTSNEGKQTPIDESSSGLSTIEEDDELIEVMPIREQGQQDVSVTEETEVTEQIGEEPLQNDESILTEDTQDVRNEYVDRNSTCSIDDLVNFDKNVSTDMNEDEQVMESESVIKIKNENTVADRSESEKEYLNGVEKESTVDIAENEGNLDGGDEPEILKEKQNITRGANKSKNEYLEEHDDPQEEKREIESEDTITEDFGNTENNQKEISGEILVGTVNVTMEDTHLVQESHKDEGKFEGDLKEPNNEDQTETYERNSREIVEKEGKEPIEEIAESTYYQVYQSQSTFNEKKDVEEMDKTSEENNYNPDGKIGNAVSECQEKEVMGSDEIIGLVAETNHTEENDAAGDIQESKADNEEDDDADPNEENETGEVNEHKEVLLNTNDMGIIEGKLGLSDEYETESIKELALLKTEDKKSDIITENEDQYDLKVDIMDEVIASSGENEDNETDKVTNNADQNKLVVDDMEEVVAMSRKSDWETDKVIEIDDEYQLKVNLEEAVAASEESEDIETKKVTENEDHNELEVDTMENVVTVFGECEDNETNKVIENDDEYQLKVDMEEVAAASEDSEDIETKQVTESEDQDELEVDTMENVVAVSGECGDNETDKVIENDDEYQLKVDMEEVVAASEDSEDIETKQVTESEDQDELEVDTTENVIAVSEECGDNETDKVIENDDEYQLEVNLEEVVAASEDSEDIETKQVTENKDQDELEVDTMENVVAVSGECEDNETNKVIENDDEHQLKVDMEEVAAASEDSEDIKTINVTENEDQDELEVDTMENVVAVSGECENNETDKVIENVDEYQLKVDMEEVAAASEGEDIATINATENEDQNELEIGTTGNAVAISGECEENEIDKVMENDDAYQMKVDMEEVAAASEGEDNETEGVIENEAQYESEEAIIEEVVAISGELEELATDDALEETNETEEVEEQESNLLNDIVIDEEDLKDQEFKRYEDEMTKDANNGVHDVMETHEGPLEEETNIELKEEDNSSIDSSMEGISEENVETVKENSKSDKMEETNVCMKNNNEETERNEDQLGEDMDTDRQEDTEDNPASGTENMLEDESIIEEELNSNDVSENNSMENEDIYNEEIGKMVFEEKEVGLMENSEENLPNVENGKNEELEENKEMHEGMMKSISENEPLVMEMSGLNDGDEAGIQTAPVVEENTMVTMNTEAEVEHNTEGSDLCNENFLSVNEIDVEEDAQENSTRKETACAEEFKKSLTINISSSVKKEDCIYIEYSGNTEGSTEPEILVETKSLSSDHALHQSKIHDEVVTLDPTNSLENNSKDKDHMYFASDCLSESTVDEDIRDNGGTHVSDNDINCRPGASESEASDLSLFSDETQDITEPIIRPEYEESLEFAEGLIENEVLIGNKTIRHFNSSQMMAIPNDLVIASTEDAPLLLCQEFDDSIQNKVLKDKDILNKRAEDATSPSHIQDSNHPLDEDHQPESLMEGEVAFSDDESPRNGSNPEGAAANSPSSDSGVVEMAGKTTNSPLECSRDNGDLRIQSGHDSHSQDSVNNETALEGMQAKRLSTKQAKDRANRITSGRRRPISASGRATEVKELVMMRSWTSLQGQDVALNNNTEGNNKGAQSQGDFHNPSSQIDSDATSRSKYQLVQDYLDNLPHHPTCKNESPLCTAGSLPGSVNEMQTDNNSDFGSSETGEGSYSERLLKALEARRLRRHRPPSSNIDHEEGPKKYRPSSLSALDAFLATLSRYRGGSECGDDSRDDSLTPSLTGDDVTVQVRAGPRHHDVRVSSRRQVRLVVNVSNPGATSDSGCVPDTSRTERLRRKEAPASGKSPSRQWNQHHKGKEDRPSTANRDKAVDAEVDQLLSDVREYLNKKLNRVGRENPTAEAPSAEIFVEGSNIEKCFKERPSVGSRTRLYPKHRPKQEEQQWRRPTQPTNPILREQQKIQNSISAINALLKQFS